MKTVVDILLVVFILLGTYAGVRKGLIKSLVSLIGLLAIVIISYTLRVPLANFLIDTLPLFDLGGTIQGLTSITILVYNILSFVVIFVLLYCILNIILAVTGFIDTLLKFTVIWIIPSKIGGAIIGFIESWIFVYLVLFVLAQFSLTFGVIKDSNVSDFILNHTPVVGTYLGKATDAAERIYAEIDAAKKNENVDSKALNLRILQIEIDSGLISAEKASELMATNKINLGNVIITKPR